MWLFISVLWLVDKQQWWRNVFTTRLEWELQCYCEVLSIAWAYGHSNYCLELRVLQDSLHWTMLRDLDTWNLIIYMRTLVAETLNHAENILPSAITTLWKLPRTTLIDLQIQVFFELYCPSSLPLLTALPLHQLMCSRTNVHRQCPFRPSWLLGDQLLADRVWRAHKFTLTSVTLYQS